MSNSARNYKMAERWYLALLITILMNNHSIWFDSPHPKLPNTLQSPNHRQQLEFDPEDSHLARPHPSPHPSPPRLAQTLNHLSPWSSLLGQDDHKAEHLSLPLIFSSRQQEAIGEVLVYSEEEQLVTPPERCIESEEEQIPTTGRKSHCERRHRIKRPRPRDKGLRKLSQKAFEIVQDMINASYKEVANKLMMELSEEDLEGEREEQNIKRRVYDALNVLIALGVLRKEGRKIISDSRLTTASIDEMGSQELQKLKLKVSTKEASLTTKKSSLKAVEEKFNCISALLHRNQTNPHSPHQLIAFPFVGILVKEQDQHIKPFFIRLAQLSSGQRVTVRTSEPVQPFGDIDTLKWLKQIPPSFEACLDNLSSFS